MVFAFAGDSTITKFFICMRCIFFFVKRKKIFCCLAFRGAKITIISIVSHKSSFSTKLSVRHCHNCCLRSVNTPYFLAMPTLRSSRNAGSRCRCSHVNPQRALRFPCFPILPCSVLAKCCPVQCRTQSCACPECCLCRRCRLQLCLSCRLSICQPL